MNNGFWESFIDMYRKHNVSQQQPLLRPQNAERNFNLDLIRLIAIFLVISVHFFWNSGFYQEIVIGHKCFLMILIRTLSMTCVPLFLLLTGYLMSIKKIELDFRYFFRIIRVVGIYILSTILILFFTKNYLHQNINIFWNIINFQQYSWYVNMYIGLFVIIPFLNIIWQNLKTEKQKKYLLFSFLLLTVFPSIVIQTGFKWWLSLYPVTYYFLGAYLVDKEALMIVNRKKLCTLLVVSLFLFGSLNYVRSFNRLFIWDGWNEYESFQNTVNAVLLFSLLKSIPFNKAYESFFKKTVRKIADLSYSMYLTSWIVDQIVYEKLKVFVLLQDRAYYYLPCVMIVFFGSFCLAFVVDKVYNIIFKTVTFLRQ